MSGDEPLDLDPGWRVPEGAGPAVCAVFNDLQHVLCEVAKALPDVASAPPPVHGGTDLYRGQARHIWKAVEIAQWGTPCRGPQCLQ